MLPLHHQRALKVINDERPIPNSPRALPGSQACTFRGYRVLPTGCTNLWIVSSGVNSPRYTSPSKLLGRG